MINITLFILFLFIGGTTIVYLLLRMAIIESINSSISEIGALLKSRNEKIDRIQRYLETSKNPVAFPRYEEIKKEIELNVSFQKTLAELSAFKYSTFQLLYATLLARNTESTDFFSRLKALKTAIKSLANLDAFEKEAFRYYLALQVPPQYRPEQILETIRAIDHLIFRLGEFINKEKKDESIERLFENSLAEYKQDLAILNNDDIFKDIEFLKNAGRGMLKHQTQFQLIINHFNQ